MFRGVALGKNRRASVGAQKIKEVMNSRKNSTTSQMANPSRRASAGNHTSSRKHSVSTSRKASNSSWHASGSRVLRISPGSAVLGRSTQSSNGTPRGMPTPRAIANILESTRAWSAGPRVLTAPVLCDSLHEKEEGRREEEREHRRSPMEDDDYVYKCLERVSGRLHQFAVISFADIVGVDPGTRRGGRGGRTFSGDGVEVGGARVTVGGGARGRPVGVRDGRPEEGLVGHRVAHADSKAQWM